MQEVVRHAQGEMINLDTPNKCISWKRGQVLQSTFFVQTISDMVPDTDSETQSAIEDLVHRGAIRIDQNDVYESILAADPGILRLRGRAQVRMCVNVLGEIPKDEGRCFLLWLFVQ